jgi:nucleoside-diphosphate-sugar epimerase
MRILITGATGLVGVETLARLRMSGDHEVVATSRRPSPCRPDLVLWDLSREEAPGALDGPWDAIVHTAADTRWTQSYEDAFRVNAASLQMLEPLVGPETHLLHVSTAYATGLRGDATSERPEDYRNSYEWSKAHAERLAARTFERLTIVRPPLIIGRRGDGRATRFAGMYTLLRGVTSSILPALVAQSDAYFDVVPVDDLAALLAETALGEPLGGVITLAGAEHAPRVGPMLDLITDTLNDWRAGRDLEPFDVPALVTPDSWNRFFLPFARDQLTRRQLQLLELLGNFQPYLALTKPLEATHTVRGVESPVAASVRFWADAHEHFASMAPRPWTAAA